MLVNYTYDYMSIPNKSILLYLLCVVTHYKNAKHYYLLYLPYFFLYLYITDFEQKYT